MEIEEIRAEAREYAYRKIDLAVSMYNPAAETIAAQAYADGIKSGLKHHAHDYLVATKRRIEKAKAEKGWHNIKDNPQDLPTEDGQYLIYEIQYGDPWYDVAWFITGANVFGTEHEKIIAWRELPKFEG